MKKIIKKLDLLIDSITEENVANFAKEIRQEMIEKEFWSCDINTIQGDGNE